MNRGDLKPIFVVGMNGSGTTMLADCLNQIGIRNRLLFEKRMLSRVKEPTVVLRYAELTVTAIYQVKEAGNVVIVLSRAGAEFIALPKYLINVAGQFS